MSSRLILGIDENGVGEALGNLYVVGVFSKVALKDLPVIRDSKRDRKRDYATLDNLLEQGIIHYKVITYTPRQIDIVSVKELISRGQVKLLRSEASEEAYIDCHLDSPLKLAYRLKKAAKDTRLTITHRLDEVNSLVALASLIGKRCRLQNLKRIARITGRNPGSGNLSDPITRDYLLKGNTCGLRTKWSLKSLKT